LKVGELIKLKNIMFYIGGGVLVTSALPQYLQTVVEDVATVHFGKTNYK
jgi:hypothetical protein